MRWFLIVFVLGIGALTYFFGLRIGYVSITPTVMYNATGVNNYTYRAVEASSRLVLNGRCETRSGQVTLRLLSPTNRQVASALCSAGTSFGLNLQGGGEIGFYRLTVEFDRFTGLIELDETRSGVVP